MGVLVCLAAAIEYLMANPLTPVDTGRLEAAAGVGVEVSNEQIEDTVSDLPPGLSVLLRDVL